MFRTLTALFIATLMLAIVPMSHAGLDDKSLVLYLSFDEGKGDKAADGSQYGHDGELIKGPTWVDGKIGKALEFDGTKSQYVIVPVADTLQLLEQFSVAFWVQRGKAQIRDWNYMVAAGSLKWAVIFKDGDKKTYVFTQSGGTWAQRGMSEDVQPEDWTHMVLTYDIKSGVALYNDGKESGGGAKPPPVDEIDGSVMVGARHPGEEFFTGVIDEVYLFNRIITEAEINELKDDTFRPVEPGGKLAATWGQIKRR